ncbi:MAG: M48 family metalloprotease [Candidatus Babeliales bacterium]
MSESILGACKLLQCEPSKGIILGNQNTMNSVACAYIKQKELGLRIDYLKYITSATNLDEVRYRYYEFVATLMHELGHLQQEEESRINNVIDQYGIISVNCLVWSAAILSWSAIILNKNNVITNKTMHAIDTITNTIGTAGIISLLSLLFVRYKGRQCEFEADEFILKGTHYHKDVPELWLESLTHSEMIITGTGILSKIDSYLSKKLWPLHTHPTHEARAQHLRDLIKKHQEEIKSAQ